MVRGGVFDDGIGWDDPTWVVVDLVGASVRLPMGWISAKVMESKLRFWVPWFQP